MSRPLWFLAAWSLGVAMALVACSGAESGADTAAPQRIDADPNR